MKHRPILPLNQDSWKLITLIVNVARSHTLTLGFPDFGGSTVVAIVLVDKTGRTLLGVASFKAFPIELANIVNYKAIFNLFEWSSKLHVLISIFPINQRMSYCDQKDNRLKFSRRTMAFNVLTPRIRGCRIGSFSG